VRLELRQVLKYSILIPEFKQAYNERYSVIISVVLFGFFSSPVKIIVTGMTNPDLVASASRKRSTLTDLVTEVPQK